MDTVYKQMGVHVFMLVGYMNSEGDAVRSKYVYCLDLCMSGASFTVRLETDSSTPVRKQFTSTFNKVGDEVWNKWDEFLQQEEERGKSNK
jgi:hypothetical protein